MISLQSNLSVPYITKQVKTPSISSETHANSHGVQPYRRRYKFPPSLALLTFRHTQSYILIPQYKIQQQHQNHCHLQRLLTDLSHTLRYSFDHPHSPHVHRHVSSNRTFLPRKYRRPQPWRPSEYGWLGWVLRFWPAHLSRRRPCFKRPLLL